MTFIVKKIKEANGRLILHVHYMIADDIKGVPFFTRMITF